MDELERLLYSIYNCRQLYQPVELERFRDWHVLRQACRVTPIKRALHSLGVVCGTHIDVGCNTGGVCREMTRYGLSSVGYDTDAKCIEAARQIGVLAGVAPLAEYVLDKWDGRAADVISCLSVYHRQFREDNRAALCATYRLMSERSRVFITDCVLDPNDHCRQWTIEGFLLYLSDTCGKAAYVLDRSDVRPLFIVTNLPAIRDLSEGYLALKQLALQQHSTTIKSSVFPSWAGVALQEIPHYALFDDFLQGRSVDVEHPYVQQYLVGRLGHPPLHAVTLVDARREMFDSIRANGVQTPVEVVVDELGLRRVDGHHRATCALVLGAALPVRVYDIAGVYQQKGLPSLPKSRGSVYIGNNCAIEGASCYV